MKYEKPVTFVCFVENHLIEKVWFARHVTANAQHMAESFIKKPLKKEKISLHGKRLGKE